MIKYICDACNTEILGSPRQVSFFYHITKPHDIGYVDNQMNRVSGRTVEYECCQGCYNRIMSKAWETMQEIKNESK